MVGRLKFCAQNVQLMMQRVHILCTRTGAHDTAEGCMGQGDGLLVLADTTWPCFLKLCVP